MLWWDDCWKVLVFLESFETSFAAARLRKLDHYAHKAMSKGFRTTVLTLEVGSMGIPNMGVFKASWHVV